IAFLFHRLYFEPSFFAMQKRSWCERYLACTLAAIMPSTGIHHITAISSDARTTHDFYTKTLGLRLVKKSVNQDDVSTYHLFFGNRVGSPGMDMTFFPFQPS